MKKNKKNTINNFSDWIIDFLIPDQTNSKIEKHNSKTELATQFTDHLNTALIVPLHRREIWGRERETFWIWGVILRFGSVGGREKVGSNFKI